MTTVTLTHSVAPLQSVDIEPWSEKRKGWIHWIEQCRPKWRVASVSKADLYYHRIVDQFLPRPKQWEVAGGFYSFRYQHPKRLYLISTPDTQLFQRLILEKVVASERELRYADWPYNVWFQYYETPELTLDRHRSYLSGQPIREFCYDKLGQGWGNPPCYYENAGVNPRWLLRDPDTGEVFLDKHGKPMKMFSGGVGVEYFMSPTGNDGNNGLTAGTAWLTFDKMTALGTPFLSGDILTLLSGTHTKRLGPPNTTKNGTALNRTTVRPIAGGSVIVLSPGSHHFDSNPHAFWEVGRTGTLFNFDMSASGEPAGATGWRMREGAHHIRFRNVRLHHNFKGVGFGPADDLGTQNAPGHEFIDVESDSHGNTTIPPPNDIEGYAWYAASTNLLLEGCNAHHCVGYGLHFNIAETSPPEIQKLGLVIRRSIGHHNGTQVFLPDAGVANIALSGTDGALVHNCLSYRFGQQTGGARNGILLGALPVDNTMLTFCDSAFQTDPNGGAVGIRVFAGFKIGDFGVSSNNTVRNCISFGNNTNFLNEPNGSTFPSNTVQDHNAFGINPNWVNGAADDYHLTASTPASILNAGVPVSHALEPGTITYDFDRVTRSATTPDIGAYEFGAGDTTPPAPPTGLSLS